MPPLNGFIPMRYFILYVIILSVDAIASLANKILVEEGSIVIFTTFVAVAKEIHQKLCDMDWAGELLTGETASKKRQAMVDRFQAKISPVFVATYGVGGVGLTLTGEFEWIMGRV